MLPVHLRQSNPCLSHNLQVVQAVGPHHVFDISKPCDKRLLQYNSATYQPLGCLWTLWIWIWSLGTSSTYITHSEPHSLVICISVRPIQVDSVSFSVKTWTWIWKHPCKEFPCQIDEVSHIGPYLFIDNNLRLFNSFNNCGIHQPKKQIIREYNRMGPN